MKIRILSIVLGISLVLTAAQTFTGCGVKNGETVEAADLMAGIRANTAASPSQGVENAETAVADFAVRLFQNSLEEAGNPLISPISVLSALAMTANGARGRTLVQMEAVFGLTVQPLNSWMHDFIKKLPAEEDCRFSLANSIWFRDDENLAVEQRFLQTNADYYGAAAWKTVFDDETCGEINAWVREHTDGMIDGILDQIPPEAVMYLVNALAFDAQWQTVYREDQIHSGIFTVSDDERRTVDFMHSCESIYLEDENAVGFMKYYAGGEYAFAALLPDEGMSIEDYIGTLTGERLRSTLSGAQDMEVNAAVPKFKSEYSIEMGEVLRKLGMTDAFDETLADFTGLGTYAEENIYMNRVLHKTFIAVSERGTRAGAATAVEMNDTAAAISEPKVVRLDRPFVYMIIDCKTNLPVFIGAMLDTAK